MILIVNLNLAVDHIVEVDELRAGTVQRSRGERQQAGGKGVNVARVLKTLGEPSLLLGFCGGRAGALIADGLRAESIEARLTRVEAESRTCLVVNDRGRREQTVINAPGAHVADAELREFAETYTRALVDAELIILNGSLPPNLPADTYARLTNEATAAGKRVLLDCAGRPLRETLGARPFIVKINGAEAAQIVDAPVEDFDGATHAARHLRELGAQHAMITLGAEGALLDFAGARYKFTAPRVRALNSVGSGDAALAGLAAALRRGLNVEAAGALAVAAGAANALHGAGACSAEEIEDLRPRVRCEVEKI
ncbi:MAG TPA: 1-phosphofructokinase family hexose kinase [Pyrinomonadaceae bacterium]|jgi:tagatose 6-phosphate kinase